MYKCTIFIVDSTLFYPCFLSFKASLNYSFRLSLKSLCSVITREILFSECFILIRLFRKELVLNVRF